MHSNLKTQITKPIFPEHINRTPMNNYYLLGAISIATLFTQFSCEIPKNVTESGYEFIHHIDNHTATPQIGDYAYCYIDMRNGEQLISSNRSTGKLAKLQISKVSNDYKTSPVIDALKLMSIGDSMTVHYRIDTLSRKPAGFENASMISYDIKLVDIKSEKEYKKDFKKQWKKATASLN